MQLEISKMRKIYDKLKSRLLIFTKALKLNEGRGSREEGHFKSRFKLLLNVFFLSNDSQGDLNPIARSKR